jgi:hypothetical protein
MKKRKVFPTVATYSRFCVQKISSPDPGEVYIIVATSQWRMYKTTQQEKKDNIKASSLHRYKPTPA